MTCKLVFNHFGSLQSLPRIFCRNQTKTTLLHLIVSRSEQKTFQRWNTPSLFKLVSSSFFFCRLNSLFQVKVFEAIRHICIMSRAGWKIPKLVDVLNITVIEFNRKWEQIQILQVKSRLFLLSLRYIAWLDEKLNLHEFNGNLKFFVFHRGKEKSDIAKNRTKCLCLCLMLAFRLFTIYHQCILLLLHAL